MVKKWFSIRNTVTTIYTSIIKFAKQLAGAILLLNVVRGGETARISDSQKEYIIKIRITWHNSLTLIMYEVFILFAIVLVVKLAELVYSLCNFNNFQMPDSCTKQNCCPITMLGNKSDVFSEISSIRDVSSIRICIGISMGYPTQFSMSGKLNKKYIEYHTSVLHLDWSRMEFGYQDEPIFLLSVIQVPLHGKFKTRKLMTC